ncbi:MAG: hypothetical protein ACTSU2_00910 [Promethearchaeota archaeon]
MPIQKFYADYKNLADNMYYAVKSDVNALYNANVYELPMINLLSHFFNADIYKNLLFVKSRLLRQVKTGTGIILGEFDAIIALEHEGILFVVEIKNRNLGGFRKKMEHLADLVHIFLKCYYQRFHRQPFNYIVPLWYFKEDIVDKTKEFLHEQHVMVLERSEILSYLREISPQKRLRDIQLLSRLVKQQIIGSEMHPLISKKLTADNLINISKILSYKEFIKMNFATINQKLVC